MGFRTTPATTYPRVYIHSVQLHRKALPYVVLFHVLVTGVPIWGYSRLLGDSGFLTPQQRCTPSYFNWYPLVNYSRTLLALINTREVCYFIPVVFVSQEGRKEMFYLTTHSDNERGNPLPSHGLLFRINSKGSFICIIPLTG